MLTSDFDYILAGGIEDPTLTPAQSPNSFMLMGYSSSGSGQINWIMYDGSHDKLSISKVMTQEDLDGTTYLFGCGQAFQDTSIQGILVMRMTLQGQ